MVRHSRNETVTEARAKRAKQQRRWRKKNREHHLEWRKQWRKAHIEQERRRANRYRAEHLQRYRRRDKIRQRRYIRKMGRRKFRQMCSARNRRLKEEFIAAYGGKCSCCGERRFEFLSAEHIYGRHWRHRGRLGPRIYYYLKKLGWPKKGYTCLCMNCNFSRGRYGYCPHERE